MSSDLHLTCQQELVLLRQQVAQAQQALEAAKKGWEYPCSDGQHSSFWKTVVTSPQWRDWENEVARRSIEHSKNNDEVYTGCWDVDECRECGWISQEHFQDFMKFTLTATVQALRVALKRYGKHTGFGIQFGECNFGKATYDGPCTCGLSAALAQGEG